MIPCTLPHALNVEIFPPPLFFFCVGLSLYDTIYRSSTYFLPIVWCQVFLPLAHLNVFLKEPFIDRFSGEITLFNLSSDELFNGLKVVAVNLSLSPPNGAPLQITAPGHSSSGRLFLPSFFFLHFKIFPLRNLFFFP